MKIEKDKSLKEFTTFKIGGNAQFFCAVQNEDELTEAVDFAQTNKAGRKVPIFVLGGGSNILISDKGFQGLVIKMEIKGVEFTDQENGDVLVIAKAGEDWDAFVEKTVEKGFYGLENLSLIPGTVGAAPVQNIGAYGSEIKDTVHSVKIFDTAEGVFKNFSKDDCQFEYRDSLFKKKSNQIPDFGTRYIVTSVTFKLNKKGKVNIDYKDVREYFAMKNIETPTLAEVRRAVVEIRSNKLPDVRKVGTVGSFFKNPIVTNEQAIELKNKYPDLPIYPIDETYTKISLAWILDKVCGYKGTSKGHVGTYKNQALVLVNNGDATAKEILDFAEEIKKSVKEKSGIDIEEEVQRV